jgi:hypothetical protein
MIRLALLVLLAVPQDARFVAYDVVVDASQPLAAWQAELTASGDAKIVGVEGGEGAVYAKPPYHDPAALQGGRIVLGAFTTDAAPQGRVRVARIHVMERGAAEWTSRLVAAAAPGGARIEAKLELVRTGGK